MRIGDAVSFRSPRTDKSLATPLPHLASLTVHTHSMCPKCLLLKVENNIQKEKLKPNVPNILIVNFNVIIKNTS